METTHGGEVGSGCIRCGFRSVRKRISTGVGRGLQNISPYFSGVCQGSPDRRNRRTCWVLATHGLPRLPVGDREHVVKKSSETSPRPGCKRASVLVGSPPGATDGADLVIFAPEGDMGWHVGAAYCIELKAGSNTQTEAKKDFEERCDAALVPYRVCRSVDEVLKEIENWGLLRPGVHAEKTTAG